MVFRPHVGSFKVGFEGLEVGGIVGDLAALEFVPGTVGRQGADVVVYVADGDGVCDFVVEDCLERGDDLERLLELVD